MRAFHSFVLILVAVLFFFVPSGAWTKTMSEINIEGFQGKKGDTRSSSESVTSPFTSSQASAEELVLDDLFLTGVILGEQKKYALISGYILTEGDSVAGLRVKSITKNKVVLQHLDKVHTLHLDGGF